MLESAFACSARKFSLFSHAPGGSHTATCPPKLHSTMTVDKSPPTDELPFVWSKIAEQLREDVSGDTFSRWFKDIELVALSDTELTLACAQRTSTNSGSSRTIWDFCAPRSSIVLGRDRDDSISPSQIRKASPRPDRLRASRRSAKLRASRRTEEEESDQRQPGSPAG